MSTETTRTTDIVLVEAAKRGEMGAIDQLLTQNWPWLKVLVAGILRNRSDTDDVLQEICIKVIRKIGTLRQAESFRAWLACLARREALRWRNTSLKKGMSLDHENAEEPVDPETLPVDEQLAEDEERAIVLDAISQIPPKYKEVLLLQHSGQSYKQIAETLDLTLTTVQIPALEMGKKAAALLLECIEQPSKLKNPERIVLPVSLVIRKSTSIT